MSTITISPDAGSPEEATRAVEGAATGSDSVARSQSWNAASVSGMTSTGGAATASAAGPDAAAAGFGFSQSCGSSATIVSTPASCHHLRALAAQSLDVTVHPAPKLSASRYSWRGNSIESGVHGLVNHSGGVYLPDVGGSRRQEPGTNERTRVDALRRGDRRCRAGRARRRDPPQAARKGGRRELGVCILEKGSEVGAHILSGAVVDPRALDELLPNWKDLDSPLTVPVTSNEHWVLTEKKKYNF